MSNKLDEILDQYLSLNQEKIFQANVKAEDRERFVEALKSTLAEKIHEEIRSELIDDIVESAEKKIEEKAQIRRIKELRKLTIDGLIVAFLVGLLVNQITDIISCLKGQVTIQTIWVTGLISLILVLVCIAFFAYRFVVEFMRLFEKRENESD